MYLNIRHGERQGAGAENYEVLIGEETKCLTGKEVISLIGQYMCKCLSVLDQGMPEHLEVEIYLAHEVPPEMMTSRGEAD